MGKADQLTQKQKQLISDIYRITGKSVRDIATFLEIGKSTVDRYKDYKTSRVKPMVKPMVKPETTSEVKVEDQELFKKMYADFVEYLWFRYPQSELFVIIKHRYWSKHHTQLRNWSSYKGMSRKDIILDLIERLSAMYSENTRSNVEQNDEELNKQLIF